MPTIVGDCKTNWCVLLLQLHKPSNLQIYEGLPAFYLIFFPSCLCLSLWAGECVPRGTSQSSTRKREKGKNKMGSYCLGSPGFYVSHAFQQPYSTLSLHITPHLTFLSTCKAHKTKPFISLCNISLHCYATGFLPSVMLLFLFWMLFIEWIRHPLS